MGSIKDFLKGVATPAAAVPTANKDLICAWAKKTADSKKYKYKLWKAKDVKTHQCPICHPGSGDGWNCIGFAFASWRHGGNIPCKCNCGVVANESWEKILEAKTDQEALQLAQKYIGIKELMVIRDTDGIATNKLRKGDIIAYFVNGNNYQHTALYVGNGLMADSSSGNKNRYVTYGKKLRSGLKVAIRWVGDAKGKSIDTLAREVLNGDWGSGDARKLNLTTAGCDYNAVQKRVNELLDVKATYGGVLPTTKIVKTNAEVIADAIRWAVWIAGDNNFHYGYTSPDKKINAHHNGCYFCGTNTTSGGRSKKGIVMYEHTYCCNSFVGAAWAHGGCVPAALKLCQNGSSWGFSKGNGYNTSSLFTNLGHPTKSSLKAGDVLCKDNHVVLYIGNGKIVEAGSGDDNKKNSEKWNNSIRVKTLTDASYKTFPRVHRFNGSVNTEMYIRHGEISKRVTQWQAFLDWYFDGKVGSADGIYGDNTLKWTKQFQEERIGKGEGDGIIGPKTLEAAKKCKK